MILRDYQIDIANQTYQKLAINKLAYICAEVRTGKTLMALEAAKLFECKNVLFLTKLKAISSIEGDYHKMKYPFQLTVINNESLHKIPSNDFDLIIVDEAHRLGAFPKMNKIAQDIKKRFYSVPMILLSGTPTPESYSQIFNQLHISFYSPFRMYRNFYAWAKEFTIPTLKYLGHYTVNDYSKAIQEKIQPLVEPYFIRFTQKQAGFQTEVKENVLFCRMQKRTYDLIHRLKRDKVIEGESEVILADTGVKLMSKIHQLSSGTVKFESSNAMTFDTSKAEFIRDQFKGIKIAIFYKFKQELLLLQSIFGDLLTTDLDEFNTTDKNIALQIISGREGISLKSAKYIVYYNIDFSATSFWQSRDRMTTMDRLENEVFWVFAEGGIEEKIYKSVQGKKDYTLSQFEKDYKTK